MRSLVLPLLLCGLAACSATPEDRASGGTTSPPGEAVRQVPTDLGVEAEREEARIRSRNR